MPYDFTRFSPQSFERFGQALAVATLGAGVQVYGQGPDGAREFTLDGPTPLATNGHHWNGYVVGQAKYRSANDPRVSPAKWLISELEGEFQKFKDQRRGLKRPEYYIVVTNVVLTPSVSDATGKGRGGLEEVEAWFEKQAKSLSLRGWEVWHKDKLQSLLDNCPTVRSSYSAWLTPSDILSNLIAQIGSPDYAQTLVRACARDLRRSRDPKHKDTGQASQRKVPLDSLFVDLPLESIDIGGRHVVDVEPPSGATLVHYDDTDDEYEEHYYELGEDELGHDLNVVAQIVIRASDKLDKDASNQADQHTASPSKVVIFGGPGQGKSTVAQFLAQLYRARTLLESGTSMSEETHEAAQTIIERARAEGIVVSGALRYPLHIELPKYADALQQAKLEKRELSLLDFAAQQLSIGANDLVSTRNLRSWLSASPWLVLLDGLDEVPPSGNRADLIAAISDLTDEFAQAKADVLTIVTTRPQGYGDDLPRKHWQNWTLASLTSEVALRFATRLANVMLDDDARRDEILREIERAGDDVATAPIMVSPLQVAIIFSLVEVKGGIPTDRWTLFYKYYELLRDREAAKSGKDAELLRDYRDQVDQVHFDAGLLLHIRAETAGSANAYLTDEEFNNLLCSQLSAEGHSEAEIQTVSGELVRIATDRLVLLSSKVGGRIAFDVRSLQEFMAAARLMSSPESLIDERLKEIAARSHWQHVVRICASKVFSVPELRHLRHSIIVMCSALDHGEQGVADALVQSGALLALGLLLDGLALRSPDLRRALLRSSLEVLRYSPRHVDDLTSLFSQSLERVFGEFLEQNLTSTETVGESAWRLAFSLIGRWPDWTRGVELIRDAWGRTSRLKSLESNSGSYAVENASVIELIHKEQWRYLQAAVNLALANEALYIEDKTPLQRLQVLPSTEVNPSLDRNSGIPLTTGEEPSRFRVRFVPLKAASNWEDVSPDAGEEWRIFSLRAKFARDPSTANLAAVVDFCGSVPAARSISRLRNSWPIVAALAEAGNADEAKLLSARLLGGGYSDKKGRAEAERRWGKNGVSIQDILTSISEDTVVHANVATSGLPLSSGFYVVPPTRRAGSHFQPVCEAFLSNPFTPFRRRLFAGLVPLIRQSSLDTRLRLVACLRVAWETDRSPSNADRLFRDIAQLCAQPDASQDLYIIASEIGKLADRPQIVRTGPKRLVEFFNRNPNERGMLSLIAMSLPTAPTSEILASLSEEALSESDEDSDTVRASVAFIRLRRGLVKTVEEEDNIAIRLLARPTILEAVTLRGRRDLGSETLPMGLLTSLLASRTLEGQIVRRRLSEGLKSRLDKRPALLSDPACAVKLHLPTAGRLSC